MTGGLPRPAIRPWHFRRHCHSQSPTWNRVMLRNAAGCTVRRSATFTRAARRALSYTRCLAVFVHSSLFNKLLASSNVNNSNNRNLSRYPPGGGVNARSPYSRPGFVGAGRTLCEFHWLTFLTDIIQASRTGVLAYRWSNK